MNFKFKKIWLWLLIPFVFVGVLTTTIVYKSLHPYKSSIYNYQSYINPDLKEKIEENYSYKEYKNNSEFINAINENKAIAGISTDYMIVDLINNQKISKINFNEAFGIGDDPRFYYTDQTNKQLEYFDNYLAPNAKVKGDVDGDGKQDFFWEYMIPIWINNKVFVYNKNKINRIINDQEFKSHSHLDILKTFKDYLVNVISWTNAPIENAVIGSENPDGTLFNTDITLENYQRLIDQFCETVKEGTGYQVNDSLNNIFEDDSDIVLQSVIDPKSIVNGAYLFNGDALDAYWSEDNFSNVPTGTIEKVNLKNSPSFVDGFVVSSSVGKEKQIEILKNLNDSIFSGKFMTKEEIENEVHVDGEIDWNKLASLSNFDYVNFTPASKGEYDFISDNYFDGDEIAKSFYEIGNVNPITPLNQELQSNIVSYFKRKLRE